ncbi:MAG: carbon starvation protein A [Erysipelotrichaceae bacterium]
MNSVVLLISAVVAFVLAYKVYGDFLAKKWGISNENKTPAEEINDDKDYIPTNNVVVLGNQFSSIAGAGPITGVIQALPFGWLPTFLWVTLGSIFVGGVHDYSSLFASVRHKGKSIGEITRVNLGEKAKKLFNTFAWLTLMLVLGAFTYFVAASFAETAVSGGNVYEGTGAKIATASFLICIAAVVFGIINHFKKPVWLNTLICLALLVASVAIGFRFPFLSFSIRTWFVLVSLYILVAANLPSWILLQPRGYLVSYLLYGVIALSFVGVLVCHPSLDTIPVFAPYAASAGGFIFPFLFVTIACGAVSGFHSLVSSGTSSKTVKKESPDIKRVGYGAMLIEGLFAVIVIGVAATARAAGSEAGGFTLFYAGIATIFERFGLSYELGYQVGGLAFSMFCLTSLDSATRIARYMFQELCENNSSNPVLDFFVASKGSSFKKAAGAVCATLATVIPGYILSSATYNGAAAYNVIWPIFGSANQLLASVALLAVTSWLVQTAKERSAALFTGIPTIFMFAVTLTALGLSIKSYVFNLMTALSQGNPILPYVILLVIAVALVLLAVSLIITAVNVLFVKKSYKKAVA